MVPTGISGLNRQSQRFSGICILALLASSGCSVYDESLLGGDTRSDATVPACTHARWPLQPPGKNLGDGTDIVVALRAFDFGERFDPKNGQSVNLERAVGYDLDEKCTKASDPNETPYPGLDEANSCSPVGEWISPRFGDLPGGRDNGLRHIIEFIATYFAGFGTPNYNAALNSGAVSLLMQVKDWNGKADDDSVQFILYTPDSFDKNPANFGKTGPAFKGDDEWPIGSISYSDPVEALRPGGTKEPKFVSQKAWVTGNTLVATFGNVDFRLRIGIAESGTADLVLKFLDAFFTATIVKKEDGLWWLKDGQIAAKWKTQDLFAQVKYFLNPFHNIPGSTVNMCLNTPGYNLVHPALCQSTDIYSGGISPGSVCDSVSLGIAFEAVQAKLGPTITFEDQVSDCKPEFDPKLDTCDKTWEGVPGGDAGASQ
jgi:hypothetical protein